MSTEDIYIKNIENGIRSIRLGSKTPQEANVNSNLQKLKMVNEGMYDELNKKYVNVVKDYNNRK